MLKDGLDDLDTNGSAGDWAFFNDDEILILRWGANQEDLAQCYLKQPAKFPNSKVPLWKWDGSREAPTLTPSIRVYGPKRSTLWHGWLQAGRLVTADDCPRPEDVERLRKGIDGPATG